MQISKSSYSILGQKIEIPVGKDVYDSNTGHRLREQTKASKVTIRAVDVTDAGLVRAHWKGKHGRSYVYIF